MPRVYLTLVVFEGDAFFSGIETIEHEGELWHVANWSEVPSQGWRTPSRLFRSVSVDLKPGPGRADYALPGLVPKCVLSGVNPPPPEPQFAFLGRLPIKFELPKQP